MTSWLHEERLRAVHDVVRECKAARLIDLGCGDGDLFVRLAAEASFEELVGVDLCQNSLERLRNRLNLVAPRVQRIELREASMIDPPSDLGGYDCAILVETIEHIDPHRLSQLERALFRTMRPGIVVITTPNAEFNRLLGVPSRRMRHPDHRFEWDRARFRRWCQRVAGVAGYSVRFKDVAGRHPELGGASQMAVFDRTEISAGAKTA